MIVLDTQEDWNWWMEAWQYVLDSADLTSQDRVLMAFSFGPFIGFWSAFDAVVERGAMVIPTGAMTSLARLELIRTTSPTVVFCTPSYAIHLAQVAEENGICLAEDAKSVKRIVVAGEPGGSIPATKARIESAWDALVVDHCGASEVGPWGFTCPTSQVAQGHVAIEHGIFVNEAEFIAEFIPIKDQNTDAVTRSSDSFVRRSSRAGYVRIGAYLFGTHWQPDHSISHWRFSAAGLGSWVRLPVCKACWRSAGASG